jgi:hypothetical protein
MVKKGIELLNRESSLPYGEKFAFLLLAEWNTKEIRQFATRGLAIKNCEFAICGQAHLRNLWSCDSGMSPRNCGFAKKLCMPTFGFTRTT